MSIRKTQKKMRSNGIATLLSVSALMGVIASTLMYTSKTSQLEQSSYTNAQMANQAFTAAEAGLEHGLAYLNTHRSTLDSDNDLNINMTMQDGSTQLSTGAGYLFTLNNIASGNLDVIQVTATGTSHDGSQSRTIRQLVSYLPMLKAQYIPKVPLTVKGNLQTNGSPDFYNASNTKGLWVGGSLNISGNIKTHTSTGMQTIKKPAQYDSSVHISDATLQSASTDNILINYFGMPLSEIQSFIQTHYTYTSNSSAIAGASNDIIWFEGDLSLSGGEVVGSATAPVVLIVNGNLNLSGNTTFYGFLFVRNTFNSSNGDITLYGAGVCDGDMVINGNSKFHYDQALIDNIKDTFGRYAKISGSWKDY